jgi:hypothetical protein
MDLFYVGVYNLVKLLKYMALCVCVCTYTHILKVSFTKLADLVLECWGTKNLGAPSQ